MPPLLQTVYFASLDPLDKKTAIRYRIDGVLDTVRELPIDIHKQMVNRIKIMAEMDITETRVPQDGRIQTIIQKHKLDLRISTLPTVRGEKVVMRILDISGSNSKIEYLGFKENEEKIIRELIAKPNGIILVSGPTGSGKTTLVSLIPRLFDATSGSVLLDGVDVRDLAPEALWSRVGIVPQKPYLFSGTVASNLGYGKENATEEKVTNNFQNGL